MLTSVPPFFYALGATLCFSYSSTIFTEFARKISPFWMNSFKSFVALISFWITVLTLRSWISPNLNTVIALISSGCIGLMIGDIFMLHAMKELGASRMLMIFGLQPFFLGIAGYFFFDQAFSFKNFIGVILMLGCLYTISLESYKKNGHWQFRGMLLGLIAILLDAVGILMTRYGFDTTPGITSPQVNAIRCVGAVAGFVIINYVYNKKDQQINFQPTWSKLNKNEKTKIVLSSIGGAYCSLMLYLVAISKGQLSVISSVAVTGPMFAGIFECVRAKRWPSAFLFIAFLFFMGGFAIFSLQ